MSNDPTLPSLDELTQLPTGIGKKIYRRSLQEPRALMFVIGILTVAINGFGMARLRNDVEAVIEQHEAEGHDVDSAKLERSIRSIQLINGGFVALGIVFIALGLAINSYPVPTTLLALVLFLGGIAISAIVDPTTIAQGGLFKIIATVGLAEAIRSAVSYRRLELRQNAKQIAEAGQSPPTPIQ
ncbi:MAG TPA: hypothetical protein VGN12_11200 [Pirellulales bacterium]|jgi:hypothetical protein